MKEAQKWSQPWLEFDMMREYDITKDRRFIAENEIEASKNSDLRMSLVTGRGYTDSQRIYLETNVISYIKT